MAVGRSSGDNVAKALRLIREAAHKGADIVCLPELFATPYFCQTENVRNFSLAEPLPGPTTAAVAETAKSENVAVIVPLFERRGPGVYHNSLAVLEKTGKLVGIYRKMHIPDDPAYYEKFYFTPGDLGFKAFDLTAGRIGTLICWDQWFPEGARLTALQGASILFYPTAIGWHPHEKERYGVAQREAWRTVQRGHAVANGIYVAAVNRVGHETPELGGPGIEFWGSTFLCDPQGVIIAEASTDREEILIGEIDIAHLEEIRTNWPFLRDRRIDAYQPITERFLDGKRT
jgi:N-carbamoylputrescine amidase